MKQCLVLCLLLISSLAVAAPKSQLDQYWLGQGTQQMPDAQPWQLFLDRYVVKQGQHNLVDYQAITEQDLQSLQAWIAQQAQIDPRSLLPQHQYAYWVKLYNALTVELIASQYPLDSIRQLGLFNRGPWHRNIIEITGRGVSLNDIEHRILRPIFADHRIHFAVNCAAIGCPNLALEAFLPEQLDRQLAQAEDAFINSEKGVWLEGDQARVSSIFDWYLEDFAEDENGLISYLNTVLKQPLPSTTDLIYDYDWQLNEAKR